MKNSLLYLIILLERNKKYTPNSITTIVLYGF